MFPRRSTTATASSAGAIPCSPAASASLSGNISFSRRVSRCLRSFVPDIRFSTPRWTSSWSAIATISNREFPAPTGYATAPSKIPAAKSNAIARQLATYPWQPFAGNILHCKTPAGILANTPGASLAPGQTASVKVVFKPKARGKRMARLEIASDDGNENPFVLKLSSVGTIGAF